MIKRKLFFGIFIFSLVLIIIYIYFAFFGVSPYAPYFLSNLESKTAQIRSFTKSDRVLIIAPHPDDETLSSAGIIQRTESEGAEVKILYLTYGDHNTPAFWAYKKLPLILSSEYRKMGELRRQEAINAMKVLGVVSNNFNSSEQKSIGAEKFLEKNNLIFLGYPDFETLNIWEKYWNKNIGLFDKMTYTSSVPYEEAFSYGAKYNSIDILNDLEEIFSYYKPTVVIYPSPLDRNSDHQAAYLFTTVTLMSLDQHPYELQYVVHQDSFPEPQFYDPLSYILPPSSFKSLPLEYMNFNLTPKEEKKKYNAILQYKSQRAKGDKPFFLGSFVRKNELFFDEKQNKPLLNPATLCLLPSDLFMGKFGKDFEVKEANISNQNRNDITFSIELSKKLGEGSLFKIYIFPYCKSYNFLKTPKFIIEIENGKEITIKNILNKATIASGLKTNINGSKIVLTIPKNCVDNLGEFFLHFEGGYAGLELYKTPWLILN